MKVFIYEIEFSGTVESICFLKIMILFVRREQRSIKKIGDIAKFKRVSS